MRVPLSLWHGSQLAEVNVENMSLNVNLEIDRGTDPWDNDTEFEFRNATLATFPALLDSPPSPKLALENTHSRRFVAPKKTRQLYRRRVLYEDSFSIFMPTPQSDGLIPILHPVGGSWEGSDEIDIRDGTSEGSEDAKPQGKQRQDVLIDRAGMWKSLFPRPRSEIAKCFWHAVDTVYVHVNGSMDWDKPVPIKSTMVLDQLFPKAKSVMIPLRDLERVEHAWSILALSRQEEVVRLRRELETAVSSVLGPEGCRVFPYRSQQDYKWTQCLNRWQWSWLYMRYLGQDLDTPFLELWTEPDPTTGRRAPKFAWVEEELTVMPKLEEVMFISVSGYSPQPGTCRLDPSILDLGGKLEHTPLSPAPRHLHCASGATIIDLPEYDPVKWGNDTTHYPFIISTPAQPARNWNP